MLQKKCSKEMGPDVFRERLYGICTVNGESKVLRTKTISFVEEVLILLFTFSRQWLRTFWENGMFCIFAVHCGSHQWCVSTEHLECGRCNLEIQVFLLFNSN